MMPGMDGIETLHTMRERGLGKGTPVVMLTANAILGDREKYIEEGFDDFLSKPIDSEKLFQMIRHFLPEECIVERKKKWNVDDIWDKIPEINFEMGMTTCSGDKDFYLELLQDFTELPIREELNEWLKDRDFKNYCIRIHAFKNNAYSIGALELGDSAFEVEKCTREGFPENIGELQERLLLQYDSICLKYRAIMDQKDMHKN